MGSYALLWDRDRGEQFREERDGRTAFRLIAYAFQGNAVFEISGCEVPCA